MGHEELGRQTPDGPVENKQFPVWYGRFRDNGSDLSIFYNAIRSWKGKNGEKWAIEFDMTQNRYNDPALEGTTLIRTRTETVADNLHEVFLHARDTIVTIYPTQEANIAATRGVITNILSENPRLRPSRVIEE